MRSETVTKFEMTPITITITKSAEGDTETFKHCHCDEEKASPVDAASLAMTLEAMAAKLRQDAQAAQPPAAPATIG